MRAVSADDLDALGKAWFAVGPSPCERFACAQAARCGSEQLACGAFRLYAERGRAVTPFSVVKDTRHRGMQVVGLAQAVEPTREVYVMLFPPARRGRPAGGRTVPDQQEAMA